LVRKRLVPGMNEIRANSENLRRFGQTCMNIRAEGRELCGREILSFQFLAALLNHGIRSKQAGHSTPRVSVPTGR
jgi:hypothetical protein